MGTVLGHMAVTGTEAGKQTIAKVRERRLDYPFCIANALLWSCSDVDCGTHCRPNLPNPILPRGTALSGEGGGWVRQILELMVQIMLF